MLLTVQRTVQNAAVMTAVSAVMQSQVQVQVQEQHAWEQEQHSSETVDACISGQGHATGLQRVLEAVRCRVQGMRCRVQKLLRDSVGHWYSRM